MGQSGLYLFHVQSKRFIWIFDGMMIGRSQGDERFPDDKALSRLHARLFLKDGHFFIEDLDTKNNTLLNFKRVETGKPRQLSNRDVIICGAQKFILSESDKIDPATLLETNAIDLQMAGIPTYEVPTDSPDVSIALEKNIPAQAIAQKAKVAWRNNRRVLLLPLSLTSTTFLSLIIFEMLRVSLHIFMDEHAQAGFIFAGILSALLSFAFLRLKWMRREQDSDFKTAFLALVAAFIIFGIYWRSANPRLDISKPSSFQWSEKNCPSPLFESIVQLFGVNADEEGCRIKKISRTFAPAVAEKNTKTLCPNTIALNSVLTCYKEILAISSIARAYSAPNREKLLEIGSLLIKAQSLSEPMRALSFIDIALTNAELQLSTDGPASTKVFVQKLATTLQTQFQKAAATEDKEQLTKLEQRFQELQKQIGPLESSSQQPDLF